MEKGGIRGKIEKCTMNILVINDCHSNTMTATTRCVDTYHNMENADKYF